MLPNLPTDNLYKFVALAGVFLVVFSISFLELRSQRIHSTLSEARKQIAAAENIQRVMPPNRNKNGPNDAEEVKMYLKHGKYFENAKALIENYERELKDGWVLFVVIMLFPVGLILAVTGFALWYCRVQKLLDLQLAIEVKKAKSSNI